MSKSPPNIEGEDTHYQKEYWERQLGFAEQAVETAKRNLARIALEDSGQEIIQMDKGE